MRSAVWWALLLGLAMTVSGCFGGDDEGDDCEPHEDEEGDEHAHDCPGSSTTGPTTPPTSTTPPAPNVLPILTLTVTDDNGTETNHTNVGGNLTFDATGSTDPDGTVDAGAIVVQDSNQTRAAPLLVEGDFQPATFGFDRPGIVNVTVNLIDDRGGFTVTQSHVYVNHPQDPAPFGMKLPGPPVASATACEGPAGNDIVDANYYKEFGFDVLTGASYVEATVAAGSASIAICGPDRVALSDAGTGTVVSNNEEPLERSASATTPYFVAALSGAANQDVSVSILVHYEPRAAA